MVAGLANVDGYCVEICIERQPYTCVWCLHTYLYGASLASDEKGTACDGTGKENLTRAGGDKGTRPKTDSCAVTIGSGSESRS